MSTGTADGGRADQDAPEDLVSVREAAQAVVAPPDPDTPADAMAVYEAIRLTCVR